MPVETAEKPTFDQAFEAAETSIEKPSKETVEKPAKGDTEAGKENAKVEQPPVETPPAETTDTEELLSKDEVAKLSSSDQANYKKMQKAYTQKTQALASERKKIENWKEVIEAFEADPAGTLRQLAPRYGLSIAEAQAAAAKEETKQDPVAAITTQLNTELRELLATPELTPEQTADGITKAVSTAMLAATQQAVRSEVEPLKQRDQARQLEEIATSTQTELEAFGKLHPDWKTHEPKMVELGKKISPSGDLSVNQYLDMLYRLATLDQSEAAQVNKVVERINKAAASAEPSESAVNTSRVTPARPKRPTIEEAFEAAEKGVSW